MYTAGFTYKLKDPGLYPEYKKAHDELWPEMAEAMRANDVRMVIYHHEGQLFLFLTAPSKAHFERSHEGPVADRWLDFMATMMVTDDTGRSDVTEMEETFAFGSFQ